MTIEGSVRGEGELEVAGRIRGALTVAGRLIVEVGAIVEADVEATDIEVAGYLAGVATAHRSVQVLAGGRLEARVKAPRLMVDDGAFFRGELHAQAGAQAHEPIHTLPPARPNQIPAVVAHAAAPSAVSSARVPVSPVVATPPARIPGFAIPARNQRSIASASASAPGPLLTAPSGPAVAAVAPGGGSAGARPAVRGAPPKMPLLPQGRTEISWRKGEPV